MPCYRCGTRQVDPGRGSSPWLRGVVADHQVLICPGCQDGADWLAELDRCAACASIRLIRRLGEVECRDCGAAGESAAPARSAGGESAAPARSAGGSVADGGTRPDAVAPSLALEVEQALAKVLRPSRRPAAIG